MNIKYFQKGFNFSQDGPGNRLVYHLQGCNMRCPWCSNPEGLSLDSSTAKKESVDDVMREILRSRKMFFDGGGVTFTGGEATCQLTVLEVVLSEAHQQGINTCIETNGTSKQLELLLPVVDHLIMDLKHYDDTIHKKITGISNQEIKHNLEKLSRMGKQVLIRTPLIHGFNDRPEDVDGFLEFYRSIDTANFTFEILVYHEYGKDKWEQAGLDYQVVDGYVAGSRKKEFEEQYQAQGFKVVHT